MKQTDFRLLLCLPLVLWLAACNRTNNRENPTSPATTNQTDAVTVLVTPVQNTSETGQITLSGATEPETTVDLGFMVSGKINQITVQEGQTIKSGQLIAGLDPTDYRLGVDIANANVARVQDEYNRLSILNQRGSIAPADYQKAVIGLREVKAHQQLAAKNLRETRLYAPISGIVARRGADPGEIISQGMALFSIVDIQPIKVRASVPEAEVGQVKTGQAAQVYISALDTTLTGKVSLIGAVADPASRTYTVKIDLPNKNATIRPGMVADVRLPAAQKINALVVPGEAIRRDPDQATYVFVVDQQKNQAFRRNITVGRLYGNNIEITSGLAPNDLVVTGGQERLNDAAPVQIKEDIR